MKERVWKIYKVTCKANGKSYIGLTVKKVFQRWNEHVKAASQGFDILFYRAIRKHGAESFEVKTLCECVELAEARVCERALIAAHGTYFKTNKGYNLTSGGEGNDSNSFKEGLLKHVRSPEHKARMSELGRKWAGNPKIVAASKARTGSKMSEHSRAKMRAAWIKRRERIATDQDFREKHLAARKKAATTKWQGPNSERNRKKFQEKTGKALAEGYSRWLMQNNSKAEVK